MATTLEDSSDGMWNSVQEFWSGKGNFELNKVRNASSESQSHSTLRPKDREGMSEMAFSSPGMCMGMSGEARPTFKMVDMALNIAAATFEFLEVIFVTQDTVGALSSSNAICKPSIEPMTIRITNNKRNIPPISRSEFVMVPPGFEDETTKARTSSGHST